MFVTVYKPCVQTDKGDTTITAQHKCILTMQGDKEAKQRKAFNQGLLEEIRKWRKEGNTVFLGNDANSGIKDAELTEFIAEANLLDLMGTKYGIHLPNTHINGSHAVDFIYTMDDTIESMDKI
eukprot:2348640-Ditylum_brightwellii.AAC.2